MKARDQLHIDLNPGNQVTEARRQPGSRPAST
jgi:hypothetical protein